MKRDDTLWKAILEDVFDDFLTFFYPNDVELFDFTKGFEFLDKELEELFPNLDTKSIRYVDKLVKVYLKDGKEKWILVHVEVQGQKDANFEERMFTYYYRIRDKYNREITAWAILTHQNANYKPTTYQSEFLGTSLSYQFNTYKILEQEVSSLNISNNPFAILVLTVLIALQTNKVDQNQLIDLKLEVIKNLLKKKMSKEKISAIMNFIKHYVRLNDSGSIIFERKLEEVTGKTYPMGIEQFLLDRERKEGREEGREEGIEKGIEKGIERNRIEIVISLHEDGLQIDRIAKITKLSIGEVKAILQGNNKL